MKDRRILPWARLLEHAGADEACVRLTLQNGDHRIVQAGAGVQFDLVWSDARLEQLVGLCDVSAEEIPVRGGDPFVAQIGERGELSTLSCAR